MSTVFDRLTLLDFHEDVFRNVVSLRQSQDLFDDLTDDPAGWALAQRVEAEVKPPPYVSSVPAIDRPFEDAVWFNAIQWPFLHWRASRFSDGSFGVWYGSQSVDTTVYESVWHWYGGLLADAGFQHESVVAERKVFVVACDAALIDLQPIAPRHPGFSAPYRLRVTAVGGRTDASGRASGVVGAVCPRPERDKYCGVQCQGLVEPQAFTLPDLSAC